MASCQFHRTILAVLPLIAVSACVSQPGTPQAGASGLGPSAAPTAVSVETDPAQPRVASYTCADGGRMTVENLGGSVRVVGSDGMSEDLPASPSNQNSRFGFEHDAIVIDGSEALVMKGGSSPMACKR